jgi:hypothetical protein
MRDALWVLTASEIVGPTVAAVFCSVGVGCVAGSTLLVCEGLLPGDEDDLSQKSSTRSDWAKLRLLLLRLASSCVMWRGERRWRCSRLCRWWRWRGITVGDHQMDLQVGSFGDGLLAPMRHGMSNQPVAIRCCVEPSHQISDLSIAEYL